MALPSAKELAQKVADLERQMADPAVMRNAAKMRRLSADHAAQQKLLGAVQRLEKIQREEEEVRAMVGVETGDISDLAEEDLRRLTKEKEIVVRAIEELLIPKDARDERDVILEIRAGAGGEEAALFAAELFRAYSRYAESTGWKMHTVSLSTGEQGGYKEVIAEMAGEEVFGRLKYERGVHRVQRVPETEKQGRVHTSTVTVAILPQAEEIDIEIRPEDLRVDTYRASGKGGQHVNKTSSAVRLTHLPTNTVVAVQDERSQHKNREKAMKILRARLLEAQEQAQHQAEAQERRSQIGTGDRSEKVRTYNFPQDRITDHRIKKSWGNIAQIMEGNLGPMLETLRAADREARLRRT